MKKVVQIRSEQLDIFENNHLHRMSVEAFFKRIQITIEGYYLLNSLIVEYLLTTSKRLIELYSGERKSKKYIRNGNI